jgi:hypothetical protein
MSAGALEHADEGTADVLARAGIATVADVLARAEAVRDLPDRSNHVLRVGGHVFYVKRSKRRGPSREVGVLATLARAGVPVPRPAFWGAQRGIGSIAATDDLAPARPLDDLLREGALSPLARDAAFRSLAQAVARLHHARAHHRDLYLNHVFVDPTDASRGVTIIDVERTRRHHGLLSRDVVKDLAAVESSIPDGVLSCTSRARFLVDYLRARRFPVRTLLGPLLRRVVAKAAVIRAHVPRTPVGAAARPAAHLVSGQKPPRDGALGARDDVPPPGGRAPSVGP